MNNGGDYRANAAACVKLAQVVNDPDTRLTLLEMAAAWLRLADNIKVGRPDAAAGESFGAGGLLAQGADRKWDPDRSQET